MKKQQTDWPDMGLVAFTVLLGLQTMRAVLPQFVYVLRDRIGWSTIQVGVLALIIFLTPFLAGWLWRLLGGRRLLAATAVGVGLFRLGMQLWPGDPLLDFGLALGGTVAFLMFWPALLGWTQRHAARKMDGLLAGLLAGVLLDVALHGAYATYDMVWHTDVATTLLILLLVLLQLASLRGFLQQQPPAPAASDQPFGQIWPWLIIGPFLFLELNIFQNVARLAALTEWTLPLAFGCTLVAHLAGLSALAWRDRLLPDNGRFLVAGAAAALLALSVVGWPLGWLAALALLVGQVALVLLLATTLSSLGAGQGRGGLKGVTLAHGLGSLLLMALLFIYYSSYDLRFPWPNTALPPAAALLAGVAALAASRRQARLEITTSPFPRPLLALWLLLLLPAFQLFTWRAPAPVAGPGLPARVMSYNLHAGFDVQGRLDMEAIARVIEEQQPDVVGLQEVSRGWVINGGLDMLTWLSRRLDMPYVYGPTADPLWGNAVLSRYPILASERLPLPPDDLLLVRGFIWIEIDVGSGQTLQLINTHFHHRGADSHVRVGQSQTILEFWQGQERTVLMGDLNAEPDTPEMEMLYAAGFADALDLAGVEPGYTYPAEAPARRIDYILVTADLTVSHAAIPPEPASDHLAVVATVTSAP